MEKKLPVLNVFSGQPCALCKVRLMFALAMCHCAQGHASCGSKWVSEILFVGSQWVPLSSSPDVALAESLMDREISPCLYLATYPFGKE